MNLSEQSILFLDIQTTGMRPPHGQVLELAWALDKDTIESRLQKLADGVSIPKRISEMTGVTEVDMQAAVEGAEIVSAIEATVGSMNPIVAIHYAQFERPFLDDLWTKHRGMPFPWKIVCTHKIAERLFPNLPSRNIRAVAGTLGHVTGEFKRAGPHVEATIAIWRALLAELESREMKTLSALEEWLAVTPKPKREKYEYNIDRMKRLELPDEPGVYRMLNKTGDVIYVGKATSLKSRVNSYFRGVKGRESRKLEMMAQVWDFQITTCATPLEAALLESDEIKRLKPPYNVALKAKNRGLKFFDRDFESSSTVQDDQHPRGPFRPMSAIESLVMLEACLETGAAAAIFYEPIETEVFREGWDLFAAMSQLEVQSLSNTRSLLAFGLSSYRAHLKAAEDIEDEETEDAEESDEDIEYTAEDIADKFVRLFLRAGLELHRSRQLTRLLNARVRWIWKNRRHEIELHRGRLAKTNEDPAKWPWQGLDVSDYDRVSIVRTEVSRESSRAEIERL